MQAFSVIWASTQASHDIKFNPDIMVQGNYTSTFEAVPQFRTVSPNDRGLEVQLSTLNAYSRDGIGIIESSEIF